MSIYFLSSIYPSVPNINKRPSPQVANPSGVNQSNLKYPVAPLSPTKETSPKSSKLICSL